MSQASYSELVVNVLPSASVSYAQLVNNAVVDSVSDTLQASAAGSQANALALTSKLNRVTNIAHDATGAVLTAGVTTGQLGTGYVVGDYIHVTQSNAYGCTFQVTAIGAAGALIVGATGIRLVYRGYGYSAAAGLATTTNSAGGSGAQITITAVGGDTVLLPKSMAGETVTVRNDSSATGFTQPTVTAGGTNYKVGDLVYPTGVTGCVLAVAMITLATGAVTFLSVVTPGTGLTTGTGIATTTNSAAGASLTVGGTQGSQSLIVYPYSGDAIQVGGTLGGANALYTLTVNKELTLKCYTAGTWVGPLSN